MSTETKTSITDLVPLFPEPKVEKIAVSDKPVAEGGEIYYLTPEQYQQKFHCKYSETLWMEKSLRDKIKEHGFLVEHDFWFRALNLPTVTDSTKNGVNHRLKHSFPDVVISHIDDRVGYGLFATKDIPANTVISIYSGILGSNLNSPDDEYSVHHKCFELNKINDLLILSAKDIGGMARFMQHIPHNENRHLALLEQTEQKSVTTQNFSQNTLAYRIGLKQEIADRQKRKYKNDEEIEFTGVKEEEVACANVQATYLFIGGFPLQIYSTIRDIRANEQLGCSYGNNYWESFGMIPHLFFADSGKIVPVTIYRRTNLFTLFDSKSSEPDKALRCAAESPEGRRYHIEYFLNFADVNSRDNNQRTALHLAVIACTPANKEIQIEKIKALLIAGAATNLTDNQNKTAAFYAKDRKLDLDKIVMETYLEYFNKAIDENQALRRAVISPKVEAVRFLITQLHNVDIAFGHGRTPLYWAIKLPDSNKQRNEIIKILLAAGANAKLVIDGTSLYDQAKAKGINLDELHPQKTQHSNF